MKKYLKKVEKFIEEVNAYVGEYEYGERYGNTYISRDVSLGGIDFLDADDICTKIDAGEYGTKDLDPYYIARLKEEVNKRYGEADLWEEIQWFIEGEMNYFKEILGGCRNNSYEYYQQLILQVQRGRETPFPHINKIKDIGKRIKVIRKWQKRDSEELRMFNEVELNDVGCYGRGGKHLGLFKVEYLSTEDIQELIEDNFVDYKFQAYRNNTTYREIMSDISDLLSGLEYRCKVVQFVMGIAEEQYNNLESAWADHVAYRVQDDLLEEILKEEINEKELEEVEE